VAAYLAGNESAFTELFNRYAKALFYYLLKYSWFKDEDHIDRIIQDTFITVWRKLKLGGLKFETPNSFRKWLYTIAHIECLNQDEKRAKSPKTISEIYPDAPHGIPDDILYRKPLETDDPNKTQSRLDKIRAVLTPDEIKLMELVGQGKSYKEIQQEPEFAEYSIDYLMRKVYIIRQKIIKLQEDNDESKEE
jgi:RNA polymerase sigma factor (sigma-70 family)